MQETGQQQAAAIMPGGQLTHTELPNRPTARQVSAWIGKPIQTVYAWCRKGLIPCKKVGRAYIFDKAVLLKWARPEVA